MGSGTGPGEQLSGRGRLYGNQKCLSGTVIPKNFPRNVFSCPSCSENYICLLYLRWGRRLGISSLFVGFLNLLWPRYFYFFILTCGIRFHIGRRSERESKLFPSKKNNLVIFSCIVSKPKEKLDVAKKYVCCFIRLVFIRTRLLFVRLIKFRKILTSWKTKRTISDSRSLCGI